MLKDKVRPKSRPKQLPRTSVENAIVMDADNVVEAVLLAWRRCFWRNGLSLNAIANILGMTSPRELKEVVKMIKHCKWIGGIYCYQVRAPMFIATRLVNDWGGRGYEMSDGYPSSASAKKAKLNSALRIAKRYPPKDYKEQANGVGRKRWSDLPPGVPVELRDVAKAWLKYREASK